MKEIKQLILNDEIEQFLMEGDFVKFFTHKEGYTNISPPFITCEIDTDAPIQTLTYGEVGLSKKKVVLYLIGSTDEELDDLQNMIKERLIDQEIYYTVEVDGGYLEGENQFYSIITFETII